MEQPRILIVSYTIPENRMGGGLLLYRHFLQEQNFTVGVVSNNPSPVEGIFYRYIPEPRLLGRLKRTRFGTWFHDYTHLVHARLGDRRLLEAALEFKPDLIFNVAETYFSFHALILARKLGIPFISYFMDWANYASHQHTWAVPIMDRMFRKLYRDSDLALCISEGMQDELGPHPNAKVIYPLPPEAPAVQPDNPENNGNFKFCFAGNLAHWYGRQIATLIEQVEEVDGITMRVFGAYHDWPAVFEDRVRKSGIYGGFKPFEELLPEFRHSDAFLLTMGFEPTAELIERTSFKTKFLDYLQFNRPILIWGPEYCTAVRIARKYGAALCITDSNPAAVMSGMRRIAEDAELRKELVSNSIKMRNEVFNRSQIHTLLCQSLQELLPPERSLIEVP